MYRQLKKLFISACISGASLFAVSAHADTLTLVVGASPGGTTDLIARGLSKDLGELLDQTVIVENKPGAGGNIAANFVARSKKDGNTLLVSFTSFSVNASLYKSLPFDPLEDFTPISLLAEVPSVLIAHESFPADTVQDVIDILKENPGKYSFGIGGIGSSLHMATANFMMQADIDELMVPYKGTAPAIQDLLGGELDLMFASTENVTGLLDSDRVKVIGLTGEVSAPQFKEFPQISDTLSEFSSKAWFGIFAPAGISQERLAELTDAVHLAAESPDYTKLFKDNGGMVVTLDPEDFEQYIIKDIDAYAELVEFTGVQLD